MLYKLVNGEVLEAVNGCVSTGKEACVFHANGGRFVSAVVKCNDMEFFSQSFGKRQSS